MKNVGKLHIGNITDGRQASTDDFVAMISVTTHEVGFNGPHLWVQIHDGQPWSREIQEDIVDFIKSHIHEGDILVHCDAGISRSSSAVVLWLMSVGFNQSQAVSIVSNQHPNARPNANILNSLYPRKLKE